METAIKKGVIKSHQLSLDVYYPIGKITFRERLHKTSYGPRHMFFHVAPKEVPNILRTSWEQPDVTSKNVPHILLHVAPWEVPYRRPEDVSCRRIKMSTYDLIFKG